MLVIVNQQRMKSPLGVSREMTINATFAASLTILGDYFGYIFWHIHDLILIGEFCYMVECYSSGYLDCIVEVVIACKPFLI